MKRGFVSLVGAGPGDPGLLTLAGQDRLSEADVVVYDRLVSPLLLRHCRPDAELIYAGKSPAGQTLTQDEINALLVKEGLVGRRVVRLKGGDPFVFGRGGEEALALAAAGVPFEVVPGVTSAVAAPAYAGVPVTHRGVASSFAVITGHEDDTKEEAVVDWSKLAGAVDTLVILMGGGALPGIAASLIAAGRDPSTPAVSVEWGTTPGQRTVYAPLEAIAEAVRQADLGTPLLTVVGEVASLREHMAWFDRRPLFGKRVLVTRTRQQASAISYLLRREGAEPVELPTLEIVPVATDDEVAAFLTRLQARTYDWTLFTSQNAVESIGAHLEEAGFDARAFAGCRLAAIGAATAGALRRIGLRPDATAQDSTSEGLLALMRAGALEGKRIFFPRAEGGRAVLLEGLRAAGAVVDELLLYESRPPASVDDDVVSMLKSGKLDAATFASSSSIRNLAALLGPDMRRLERMVIACIGPATAATAREHGLPVAVESAEQSVEALVEALKQFYGRV